MIWMLCFWSLMPRIYVAYGQASKVLPYPVLSPFVELQAIQSMPHSVCHIS